MSGYLMAVHYTNGSTPRTILVGIPDGAFPDQATAISFITTEITNTAIQRGETPTGVVTLVSATR
jgi:hypothetical protein